MPDSDLRGEAWRLPPSRYLAGRPAEFALPAAPSSRYVTMGDGCRLAVDVWLPQGAQGRIPAILVHTPYYRRFSLREGGQGERSPNAAKFRDAFVPRGYALVVVDIRGTGASFGTRDSFRSPKERADAREIADWIVAQPWSDGRIGATGISYPGAASDFLASTGHPAVRAIAPLFAVWDTWADHYYPGGVYLNRLAQVYDALMVAMDHDRRDLLRQVSYYANPDLAGPAPVEEDPEGVLLRAAVREHLGNFRQPDFMADLRFREEPLAYDPGFSSANISPYSVRESIPKDVAVYAVSGWMDGAGYANSAIARYLTMQGNPRHLLLGPWDHGARINVSPWRAAQEPEFPLVGEVLRFFDEYLMGRDTGLRAEAPIHYFAMAGEEWRAAGSWPPQPRPTRWHLAPGALQAAPAAPAEARHATDAGFSSGAGTRYERIAAIDSRDYYADWQQRQAALPAYDGPVFAQDTELAGNVLADLTIAADTPDACILLYLSEVEADGTVRYVTEGLLRALHRKEAPHPPSYQAPWPFRSFHRADAAPLTPGVAERIRIPLLPTAWVFRRGSRLRLSIAGGDADHLMQVPHGRPPVFTLHLQGCALDLPLRAAGA
ncbi:CocE/NonD family hydrolase [Paracraurococcus ruber]|uniref:Hydrolase n=1 Tax=Paracraurococcus ruber TaxID=77675 RepID=A0ABS1CUE6_9PROT|nr:CocE/NonD family hydrolase [Paracraurococcus ruber]MBK1658125.1 hydrolase [Paracraurococcus ruber]TDG28886.1 CocE/NonD family hydrolase [Paracraurococcus ruber]